MTLLQLARVHDEAADALAATVEDLVALHAERLAIIAADAPDVPEHEARQTAALEIGAEFARRFIADPA